ncbi:MAG TPA: hypothetical protein VG873_10040 [Burkholderiales bacterium]|nr:hypothetical protein [Burkholderiales bacterium]
MSLATSTDCRDAWLWGIPTAWAVSLLLIGAEMAHGAGHGAWGNALDLARLLVYWAWLRAVWKCSAAGSRIRSLALRVPLLGGLVVNALV